jgi:DNA polymerase III epsilon subunit-like protein
MYHLIQFDERYAWSERAQQVHGLTQEYLAVHGQPMSVVAQEILSMVYTYNGPQELLILGHRPHFDIAFLDQLAASIDIKLQYDPIKIDTAALAALFLGVESSNELFDIMGFPPRKEHNALEDITMTLGSAQRMKQIFMMGLEQGAA